MLKGKVWRFGADVDTDMIIPARYLNTTDPAVLAAHCFTDVAPEFARQVVPGEIIVAGKNFGCGSSREHAPIALKAAGISCVIAASFARIFYRNAINIGLPIFECPEDIDQIQESNQIEIDVKQGLIRDLTTGKTYAATPFPEFMQKIISTGGLIEYVREKVTSVE